MARKKGRAITYYSESAIRTDDAIIVCAWDTETRGLGGDLLMVQYGSQWAGEIEIFEDSSTDMLEKFFNYMLGFPYPCVWFAHNAQYDFRYLLPWLIERGIEFDVGMRTDTDIYEIRIMHGGDKYVLRDSFALFSHSLADLAKRFCPADLQKHSIDIENFDPANSEHIAYARRDIEILLVGLPKFFDMIVDHFGVNPAGTAAGTAVKAWQRTIPEGIYYNAQPWGDAEKFIRDAYYGGLVFLTDTNPHYGPHTYDLNSSYPASMMDFGVPYGAMVRSDDFEGDHMGIYQVRVKAPDNLIVPILPSRDAKGNMRWRGGEFETTVTNRELVFAVEHGYEVLEIIDGYVFEEIIYPFDDFIGKCKTIRKDFKGTALEFVAKLLQNSLYGKFGSRRERLKMMASHVMDDDDFIGAVPYDEDGLWYVMRELDEQMRCLPQWAVFITAHSRLRLLQAVYSIGPENCIYGDTDSITVQPGYEHLLDVGDDYGQWKFEKEWKVFRAIAPKVYAGIHASGKHAGTYQGAAKGIPRRAIRESGDKVWADLLERGATRAEALSLPSLRVALKSPGLTPAKTLSRVSSSLNNSANYELLPDGAVRVKKSA